MRAYFLMLGLFLFCGSVNGYAFAAAPEHGDHHAESPTQGETSLSGYLENGIRIVDVKASRYKFSPDPIIAKLGETVRLEITSTDVVHGLGIKDFAINVSVPAGKTEAVEFLADKKGTFHVHCSVYCGPGHGHMHGTLLVID